MGLGDSSDTTVNTRTLATAPLSPLEPSLIAHTQNTACARDDHACSGLRRTQTSRPCDIRSPHVALPSRSGSVADQHHIPRPRPIRVAPPCRRRTQTPAATPTRKSRKSKGGGGKKQKKKKQEKKGPKKGKKKGGSDKKGKAGRKQKPQVLELHSEAQLVKAKREHAKIMLMIYSDMDPATAMALPQFRRLAQDWGAPGNVTCASAEVTTMQVTAEYSAAGLQRRHRRLISDQRSCVRVRQLGSVTWRDFELDASWEYDLARLRVRTSSKGAAKFMILVVDCARAAVIRPHSIDANI